MNFYFKPFIIAVVIPLLVGSLSSFFVGDTVGIYESLTLPAFAPPPIVFPIVWTILFILMGISSYLVFTSNETFEMREQALQIYALQLIVNFFWPLLFFGQQKYLLAFVWVVFLLSLIISMIFAFAEVSKTAAILQVPYLIWTSFAAVLNFCIYMLNTP